MDWDLYISWFDQTFVREGGKGLLIALIVFVLTALGGFTMLVMRLRGSNPPLALALLHGLLGVSGLVVLGWHLWQSGWSALPGMSFVLLAAAACGGLVVLSCHLLKQTVPVTLTILHGASAIIGIALLLIAVVLAASHAAEPPL